jgi:hypothetical protein
MVGYVFLYFCRGTALVFVGSLIMMCGYLGTGAMLGAMVRDRTPENKAGLFQGQRIIAQVLIPGVIGPAIGAKILANAEKVIGDDGTAAFVPNENIFLGALIAAVFIWFVVIPLARKKEDAHAE